MKLFACIALAVAGLGATTNPPSTTVRVHVIDSSGAPIAAAVVTFRIGAEHQNFPTDAGGYADVVVPPIPLYSYWAITAFAPGHVPAEAQWLTSQQEPLGSPPQSLELPLPPGQNVSGVIRNEQGEPISGAAVRLFFKPSEADEAFRAVHGKVEPRLWNYPVKTDSHGVWRSDMAPKDWALAYIMPSHPDYYAPEYLTEMADPKSLLNGTAAATLARGRSVAGIVRDSDGKPVAGAVVQCGTTIGEDNARTTTTLDGTFRISNAITSTMEILATASGHVPALATLPAGNVTGFELKMPPSVKVRGRVVDDAAQPVQDVLVTISGWGKSRFRAEIIPSVYTDQTGAFQFDHIPAGVTPNFNFYRPDFTSSQGPLQKGLDLEQQIVLTPLPRITGRVIDANTGKPIPKFRILTATNDQGWSTSWTEPAVEGKDGSYDFVLDSHLTHRVRIEADGYLAARSDVLDITGRRATFNAAMVAAPDIAGRVLDDTGAAVSGARVIMLADSFSGMAFDDQLRDTDDEYREETGTDVQGRFKLPPPGEAYELLALSDAGYACVSSGTFESPRTIRLGHWSEVTGTVRNQSSAAAGVTLFMRDDLPEAPHPFIGYTTSVKTDAQGTYTLKHVPAGPHTLVRQVALPDDMEAGLQSKTLSTRPDQTLTLDFGTGGRDVIGTVMVPPDLPDQCRYSGPALILETDGQPSPASQAWTGQDTFMRGSTRAYRFSIEHDGSFRIPMVEPGKYLLVIESTLPMPGAFCGTGDVVARCVEEVNIGAGNQSPVDLRRAALARAARVAVGEAMPDFRCPTLEGQTLNLADYHGKCVVLCFWASWCGPCIAEMPLLRKAYAEMSKDARAEMIGVSLDELEDTARAAARKQAMAWPQGRLPGGFDGALARRLGVQAVPSIWIIGPDGKVAYKEVLPESIAAAVRRVLLQR